MIRIIGIISILIGSYMIYKVVELYRKNILTEYEVLLWGFFGIIAIVVGITQSIIDYFLGFLEFTSRANFVFSISILAIYVITLKIYIRNKRVQKEITKIVRKIGIKKYEEKK